MSISWKASLPMSAPGTLPVIATIGTESSWAVPMRGDEVGGAGAAGAHAHADPAARPGVAVRRVGAALLVADEDVPDLGVVAEDVVDRQDDAARVAEQRVGALADERLHERVRADPGPLPARGPRGASPGGPARPPQRAAVPSPGTWLRRGGGVRRPRRPAARPSSSSCPAWVPLSGGPATAGHTKTLATRRGSLWFSVAGASVASVPPRSSVLPPGAGNEEAKKALKAGQERAKKVEEGYALGLEVAQGHVDAASIRRHDDGDAAAVATLEEVQATRLQLARPMTGVRSVAAHARGTQPPNRNVPVWSGGIAAASIAVAGRPGGRRRGDGCRRSRAGHADAGVLLAGSQPGSRLHSPDHLSGIPRCRKA